jgi:gamma-glutamylputrescine oxidase
VGNLSYWEKDSFFKDIEIAIIGSGIVGLCSAIELKHIFPTKKIVIFERSYLPSGASTKNAGFACFGSVSEILKDLEQYTENEVYSLIERRWKGLNKLRKTIGDANLGYEPCGGFELFNDNHLFERCMDLMPILNQNLTGIIGKSTFELADSKIEKFGFKQANHLIFNQYEGKLNTGKMMKALIEKAINLGIEIFNGISISNISDTNKGVILTLNDATKLHCEKVLVTTNAFAKKLLPQIDVVPGRGQVIVTKPIANLKVDGAFHWDCGYYYFRNINDRILLGGGRNLDFKAEETTEFGITDLVQHELNRLLAEVILPDQKYEIEHVWSGIMGFGEKQEPIIEQISSNLFCAVKCQGMGVALGALVGEEAANLLNNRL